NGVYAYDPLTEVSLFEDYEYTIDADTIHAVIPLEDLGLDPGQTIALSAFQEGASNDWQVDWIESFELTLTASREPAMGPLRVDFNSNQDGGGDSTTAGDPGLSAAATNQAGWSSYHANHEVIAEFTTADYGGITVTPDWPNTTDNRVRQSIDRGSGNDSNWDDAAGDLNLVTDWIGIDTRTGSGGNGDWDGTAGTPTYMTLALGGLAAGNYDWTSFHHDTEHCHGPFAVWLSTDGGATFAQLDDGVMTDSTTGGTPDSGAIEVGPDAYSLSSTYHTSFSADGVNAVVLRFAPYSETPVHRQIWGMNGFVLELDPRIVLLEEDFEGYIDDANLAAAGWTILDTPEAIEASTWTITNPGGRGNPATLDGSASTGQFLISDSDQQSESNPVDSGASHDVSTPSFSTLGVTTVWLHVDVSAQLNNNGSAIFDVEVSTDGGGTWANVFSRVAPGRASAKGGTTRLPDNTNVDGYFGRLDVDISAVAADQADVQVRFRHFEPTWDWWIAIDNVVVDNVAAPQGGDMTVFSEDFSNGLGQMNAVSGEGNTGTETWHTTDKGVRYVPGTVGEKGVNRLGPHPNEHPEFAIIDSDADPDPLEDEWLMTPSLDLSGMAEVFLHYESETVMSSGVVNQEVLVSLDGGTTFEATPIFAYTGGGLFDNGEEPVYAVRIFDVSGTAAGQSQVVFAFRYTGGGDNWWWAVDNVAVTGTPEPVDPGTDGLVVDQITSGDPATREVIVYLPPSYNQGGNFPVVYLLHGYTGNARTFASNAYTGFYWPAESDFPEGGIYGLLNDLIIAGELKEMIVVMPDASNMYGGSWYANSELAGNYEDYIVEDLVSYIDSNYRTIPSRDSRAIVGHSMGG
ncbi:MAG: alpha/beta hydrolase-fold protein, partial [Planctomycetota bacterium]